MFIHSSSRAIWQSCYYDGASKGDSLEPQRIGKYELTKFLGGGMSHVYAARDTLIGRTVAVKILTGAGALDDATRARFVREAQLAGNVLHENIIRVYDFGEESGRLFMVMEFLEGEDLNDAIQNNRTGSLADRIAIAVQIASAVEHIHALEIVHRDLKPHNVFVTRNGVAKLMDFGIAKTADTSLTKTGFALGTPSYMAPEQVLGKPVNHLSDIYSFGIMLFELITNAKPLQGDTLERVFWLVLNEPVDLAPLREAGAPPALVELVRRCTDKNPAARPQSFAGIRDELASIRRDCAAAALAPAQPARRESAGSAAVASRASQAAAPPRKAWVVPVGLGAAALVVVGALLFAMRGTGSGSAPAAAAKPVTEAQPSPALTLPSGDMVLVNTGTFLFGESKQPLTMPAYYIDRTEVTNAAYGDFLKETRHAPPAGFKNAPSRFPVVNVTIQDAREFARWARKRLPSAAEWEKAARGTDGRLYPWGDEKRSEGVNVDGKSLREADTCSAASPYGACEMSGNAFELVDERVVPTSGAVAAMTATRLLSPPPTAAEPWCRIRGGSFKGEIVPVWESGSIPERFRSADIGFRCARDAR